MMHYSKILLIGITIIAGCGAGSSSPQLPADLASFMSVSAPVTSSASRVFSRHLVVCGSSYSSDVSGGVYIVTPDGATKYTYVDDAGNSYTPTWLTSTSRNGWCIFVGKDYSIFYNAFTKQAARYPVQIFALGVVDEKTYLDGLGAVRWNGSSFSHVVPVASASRPGFNGVGAGQGMDVVGSADTSLESPAVFGAAGITVFSPLAPGQRSSLILFGGDGNYYGTSRRGDPIVAVKWAGPTSPVEVPGVGIDIRDVNTSGDILASPMLYKGESRSKFTVSTVAGIGEMLTSEATSIADDGAILGRVTGKGFSNFVVAVPR